MISWFPVNINDSDSPTEIEKTITDIRDYVLERVGEELTIDMISVSNKSNNIETFVNIANKAWEVTQKPLILRSNDTKTLTSAAT